MFNLIYNNTVLFLLLIGTATVLIREFNINITTLSQSLTKQVVLLWAT